MTELRPVTTGDRQFDYVAGRVFEAFSVSLEDLIGPSMLYRHTWPRQVLCYALREIGWDNTRIGQRLGGRDHSTISHAVKKVETRIRVDPDDARMVAYVCETIPCELHEELQALHDIESAAERIHRAMRDAVAVMERLEARAREIRATITEPVTTRGVAS